MGSVTVVGNATVDVIQRVDRLPSPGETLLSRGLERCAGGKGLNQAVAAARAGAHVRLLAPVGDDLDAAFIRATLATEDRLRADLPVMPAPTDISSIWVSEDGENMIVSSAGCATGMTAEEIDRVLGDGGPVEVLVLQGNLTVEATRAAAATGRARGARIVLNTAPIAWDMLPLLPMVDVIVANGPEARHMTGLASEDAVAALLAAGCGSVVITRGAHGAWLGTVDGVRTIAAPVVHAVDTAGAGDVTVGTLSAMLAQKADMEDALRIAVATASLSVTRYGTTPSFPTRDEIASFRSGG